MSDENDVDGTDDGNKGGGGLRKQLEEALAQNKTLAQELQGFRAQQRTASVQSVLKAKGVPEGAAKFYTDEDVSEAAVDKWLKENEGVFGPAQTQQTQTPEKDTSPEANAARRVADASFSQPDGDTLSDAAKILGDPEELARLLLPPEQGGASDDELVRLGLLQAVPKGRNVIRGGYVPQTPLSAR